MSWLIKFWDSSIQDLSRDARLFYLYLIGRSNCLGMSDNYLDQMCLDTKSTRMEIETALVELVRAKRIAIVANHIVLTDYVYRRRDEPDVMEDACGKFNDLPPYLQTELGMIPIAGLEFLTTPSRYDSYIRFGVEPGDFPCEDLTPNPEFHR